MFIKYIRGLQLSAVIFGILSLLSCRRVIDKIDNSDQATDSTTLLTNKWRLIKDSVSNIGNYYFMDQGKAYYPMPGVYFGVEVDYWEFKSNGTINIYENNQSYSSFYKLFPSSKLVIDELLVHDTGRIVTLTSDDAIIDWSKTSPNNGSYYRRVYLRK